MAIHNYLYNSVFLNKIRPHFISSTVEHPSITDYLIRLENDNVADITWVKPMHNGEVPISDIIDSVNDNTVCIFLQSVNSETGCEQNVAGLWRGLIKKRKSSNRIPKIHIDHVQGFRKIDLPSGIADTLSISLHKIGAPLGIGILLYRSSMNMVPLIAGKQNDSMRGGTYNIGAIAAASRVVQTFEMKSMSHYKKYFLSLIGQKYEIVQYSDLRGYSAKPMAILFSDKKCLPHTLFMTIAIGEPICGKIIKEILFNEGFTIGTGTACANEAKPESHTDSRSVYQSRIGSMASSNIEEELKIGFIRISFNNYINEKNLKQFATAFNEIPKVIEKIRQR
jgi:cysteine sulfinate desulfinase/cysteine desulfurase-like protein